MTEHDGRLTVDIEAMRDLDRWERPVHLHASLADFLATHTLADGIHAIAYCGRYLELNLHRRSSRAMLVFFSAALSARTAETRLPVFSGASALKATDASLLMVNDPGLYLDNEIRLAWYAGAADMPLQADLGRALRHVQDVLSIERPILYGASGGGFAALFYAPFMRNAIAVPCNPQIDLLAYSRHLLSKYLKAAYGYQGHPSAFLNAALPGWPTVKLDAAHMGDTRILYLQNALDKTHLERHFLPFLKHFGIDRSKELIEVHSDRHVSICSDGWGEGHRAAPGNFVYALLHSLTQADGWEKLPEFVPDLHARTTNPIRQVTLSVDKNGFLARITLAESQVDSSITLNLLRGGIEIETLQTQDGEPGRFTTRPTAGHYCVLAKVERTPRSWKERASALLQRRKMHNEMKSRVVVIEES